MMASPVVSAIGSTYELLGASELTAKEQESGEFAFGALLYQYGADLDARLLVLLFLASTAAPRLAEITLKKRQSTKEQKTPAQAANAALEQARNGVTQALEAAKTQAA